MRDLLRYLFRPSKNNREAVKLAYLASMKPTHVMLMISFVMCIVFMVLSFTTPSFFGQTAFYHRICYTVLFVVVIFWCAVARYAVPLTDLLAERTALYRLGCNMDISAARTAYEGMR